MSQRVRVRVAGPYACYSRPEMKVERVSYEVMTPSAARGVLDAILWRPEMRWMVRRIEVLRPIRFVAFRRNELQKKIIPSTVAKWMDNPSQYHPQAAGAGSEDATPRGTLALKDPAYVIEAEPLVFVTNSENSSEKYVAMFNRRMENGQCFHRPYLGCREFACTFSPPDPMEQPIAETLDLGMMLYDIAFGGGGSTNQPLFFHAVLQSGVLDTDPRHVFPDSAQREGVLRCSYKR